MKQKKVDVTWTRSLKSALGLLGNGDLLHSLERQNYVKNQDKRTTLYLTLLESGYSGKIQCSLYCKDKLHL